MKVAHGVSASPRGTQLLSFAGFILFCRLHHWEAVAIIPLLLHLTQGCLMLPIDDQSMD